MRKIKDRTLKVMSVKELAENLGIVYAASEYAKNIHTKPDSIYNDLLNSTAYLNYKNELKENVSLGYSAKDYILGKLSRKIVKNNYSNIVCYLLRDKFKQDYICFVFCLSARDGENMKKVILPVAFHLPPGEERGKVYNLNLSQSSGIAKETIKMLLGIAKLRRGKPIYPDDIYKKYYESTDWNDYKDLQLLIDIADKIFEKKISKLKLSKQKKLVEEIIIPSWENRLPVMVETITESESLAYKRNS